MRSRHVVTSAASAGTVPCIALRSRVARSGETAGADGWIRCNHGATPAPPSPRGGKLATWRRPQRHDCVMIAGPGT